MTPDELLEALKEKVTARKRKSLDVLFEVCREQSERGSPDFSVVTIGRLSAQKKGPATQSIRNPAGKDYRALISCWAAFSKGSTRKPNKPPRPSASADALEGIEDVAMRAYVGSILSENTRLRGQVRLLQSQAKVVIDRRKTTTPVQVELLPKGPDLTATEVAALRSAIADEFLAEQAWSPDESGRIRKANGRVLFQAGFTDAIRKILDANSSPGRKFAKGI